MRRSAGTNENWVRYDNLKSYRNKAKLLLAQEKEKEINGKFKYIEHPTSPITKIRVKI